MYNSHHRLIPDDRSPLSIFLLFIACCLAGLFVASFVALISMLPFVAEAEDVLTITNDLKAENWWALMISQMMTSITLFIVTPYVYVRFVLEKENKYIFTPSKGLLIIGIVLSVVITISFMGFNAFLVDWNSKMVLPDFMKTIEDSMRESEENLGRLTQFLTDIQTPGKYLFALFVIAVLPGIGEEYLFRGVLQTQFEKFFKNPHVAIILAAVIFSGIHFQFYGFLPRAALGIIFGYLFHYSGNLIYPMVAHFVNNGLTVTMLYLANTGVVEFNIEEAESPELWVILLSLALGIMFMFVYRKVFSKREPT